jgi:hypothetical protein
MVAAWYRSSTQTVKKSRQLWSHPPQGAAIVRSHSRVILCKREVLREGHVPVALELRFKLEQPSIEH